MNGIISEKDEIINQKNQEAEDLSNILSQKDLRLKELESVKADFTSMESSHAQLQ